MPKLLVTYGIAPTPFVRCYETKIGQEYKCSYMQNPLSLHFLHL